MYSKLSMYSKFIMPSVELMESQKQIGIGKNMLVRLGCFYGGTKIPIQSASKLKLNGEIAGLLLNIMGRCVGLNLFLCDSTSKQIIITNKKVLCFFNDDVNLVAKNGFICFKIFCNLKTRDWENEKSNVEVNYCFCILFVKLI